MVSSILGNASFFQFLLKVDEDIAAEVKTRGCVHCGSTLDRAHYQRKARGGPCDLAAEVAQRLSFCCRADGCRRRHTPASTRFLGAKVYFSVVLVIANAMMGDIGKGGYAKLAGFLKADRRSLRRWRKLFGETFPLSKAWRALSQHFMPPLAGDNLAKLLLDRFGICATTDSPDLFKPLANLLRFISPLGQRM